MVAIIGKNHAVEKHGRNGKIVMDAMIAGKSFAYFKDPKYKKTAKICRIDDGLFGVGIFNKSGNMLTGYIRRESFQNVREYFINQNWIETNVDDI